jgi:glutamate racemase
VTPLQDKLDIPVLGVIKPGAEAACKRSKNCIGVIGTTATISSKAYEYSILEKKPDAKIMARDCPLFVPLVEEGWLTHEVTRLVAREYLLPLKERGIDSLVLGCTHYPVLKGVISAVLGDSIKLIDSAEVTAEKVYSILQSLGWINDSRVVGSQPDEFFVTDSPERFKKVGEIFLNRKIEKVNTAII